MLATLAGMAMGGCSSAPLDVTTWPVADTGGVDLMRVDGHLQPRAPGGALDADLRPVRRQVEPEPDELPPLPGAGRLSPIALPGPGSEELQVTLTLPKGWTVAALPAAVEHLAQQQLSALCDTGAGVRHLTGLHKRGHAGHARAGMAWGDLNQVARSHACGLVG